MAVSLGFADPSEADFDSTVQEANISYPADASLMTKLCGLGKKVIDYLGTKTRGLVPQDLVVDMKAIKEKARAYFFTPKNTPILSSSKKRLLGYLLGYLLGARETLHADHCAWCL